MSDIVWQALIGAVVTISLAYMQLRTRQSVDAAAEKAAKKVEEVKTKLETTTTDTAAKLDGIAKTGDAVHVLVNNNMRLALQSTAALARKVAHLTGTAEDKDAARAAEQALVEHDAKQKTVDAGKTA